jgi:dUTP pyrophosphatase
MDNTGYITSPEVLFTKAAAGDWSADPVQMHVTDAGYDLTVSRDVIIPPKGFATLPTNVAIALPHHMWAMLVGRSSTFYNKLLMVNTGIIDSDYRGELRALVYNPGDKRILARKGERLFQLILMPRLTNVQWRSVDVLPDTPRGSSGFGSTGGFDNDNVQS